MTTCGGGAAVCDEEAQNHTLCLAVVRENGADLVLFDATGVPRSFTYSGDAGKLCFSTHGADAVDDLLTPCFDEDGNHGAPDEGCFCGVDTPHLHAHLHDPKKCEDETKTNAQGESDVQYLAQLTLYPTHDSEQQEPLVNMAVSAQLPKQCNSEELSRRMGEHGLSHGSIRQRRMHKIQHGDHEDFLVHNETTGDLTLEHPCLIRVETMIFMDSLCWWERDVSKTVILNFTFSKWRPHRFIFWTTSRASLISIRTVSWQLVQVVTMRTSILVDTVMTLLQRKRLVAMAVLARKQLSC